MCHECHHFGITSQSHVIHAIMESYGHTGLNPWNAHTEQERDFLKQYFDKLKVLWNAIIDIVRRDDYTSKRIFDLSQWNKEHLVHIRNVLNEHLAYLEEHGHLYQNILNRYMTCHDPSHYTTHASPPWEYGKGYRLFNQRPLLEQFIRVFEHHVHEWGYNHTQDE